MRIPQSTLAALDRYVKHGIPTGDFLRAALANDFAEAVLRADQYNFPALREIVLHIHNELPSDCHGSPEKVKQWIADHFGRKSAEHQAEVK